MACLENSCGWDAEDLRCVPASSCLREGPLCWTSDNFPGNDFDECLTLPGPTFTVPFTAEPHRVVKYREHDDPGDGGNCLLAKPIDMKYSEGSNCMSECFVGWTRDQEALEYAFLTPANADATVDVTIRVSSKQPRVVLVSLDFRSIHIGYNLVVSGTGWLDFYDLTVPNVFVPAANKQHRLSVIFYEGKVNLCSVSVTPSIPFMVGALDFVDYYEIDEPLLDRGADYLIATPVDAKQYTGSSCPFECVVGWTRAGEWLDYAFWAPSGAKVDITARVASKRDRRIKLRLDGDRIGGKLIVPGNGWDDFSDLVVSKISVEGHKLHHVRVEFAEGKTNLCSLSVSFA